MLRLARTGGNLSCRCFTCGSIVNETTRPFVTLAAPKVVAVAVSHSDVNGLFVYSSI